tara:strand:- start:431 stop:712 length:282 start_codon:yes stop_codon:yes gene_type:complete
MNNTVYNPKDGSVRARVGSQTFTFEGSTNNANKKQKIQDVLMQLIKAGHSEQSLHNKLGYIVAYPVDGEALLMTRHNNWVKDNMFPELTKETA